MDLQAVRGTPSNGHGPGRRTVPKNVEV